MPKFVLTPPKSSRYLNSKVTARLYNSPFISPMNPIQDTKPKEANKKKYQLFTKHSPDYSIEKLTNEQRNICHYIIDHPTSCILIQAGPGCGKSFTLLTIAHCLKMRVNVVIFKNDLLEPFKSANCQLLYSNTKFLMDLFKMSYKAIEWWPESISKRMDVDKFIMIFVGLLKQARLPDFRNSILIIDEYTVFSKPFLALILILCKINKIGVIISGDKNQLQTFHSSKHSASSSFFMIQQIADKHFSLTQNLRCQNKRYNDIIEIFSTISCNANINDYGFAIVAALFHRQVLETKLDYNHIHIAHTHAQLAKKMEQLHHTFKFQCAYYKVSRKKHELFDTRASLIHDSKEYQDDKRMGKFPPYLPLVKGALYYMHTLSEYSLGTLIDFDISEYGSEWVLMRPKNGTELDDVRLTMSTNDNVVFPAHKDFLLDRGSSRVKDDRNLEHGDYDVEEERLKCSDKLYNFPIYPFNFMSIYKCQGTTIADKLLDINLVRSSFESLYVALSRVTDPSQIASITIPTPILYLTSTIVNFPCLIDNLQVDTSTILSTMPSYVFYKFGNVSEVEQDVLDFFRPENTPQDRATLARRVKDKLRNQTSVIVTKPIPANESLNTVTLEHIIDHKDIYLGLSNLNMVDRSVWVHEYVLNSSNFYELIPTDNINESPYVAMDDSVEKSRNGLERYVNLDPNFTLKTSSQSYIESNSIVTNCPNNYCIAKDPETNYYLIAPTLFCYDVYMKHKKQELISEEWLIDQLNQMLETNFNDSDDDVI